MRCMKWAYLLRKAGDCVDKVEYLVIDDTVDIGKEPAPITDEERKARDELIAYVKKTCRKNKE